MHKNWIRLIFSCSLINNHLNNNNLIKTETTVLPIDTNDEELIELYKLTILNSNNNYIHSINSLFKDLEKIKKEDSSSVNNKIDNYLEKAKKNNLDKLEKISLYEHTKNVLINALEITKEKPSTVSAIVILLSLVHDFGKSKYIYNKVKELENIHENTRHDIVSAYYLKILLTRHKFDDNLEQTHINYLFDLLSNHHNLEKLSKFDNDILNMFQESDRAARVIELKRLNSDN